MEDTTLQTLTHLLLRWAETLKSAMQLWITSFVQTTGDDGRLLMASCTDVFGAVPLTSVT